MVPSYWYILHSDTCMTSQVQLYKRYNQHAINNKHIIRTLICDYVVTPAFAVSIMLQYYAFWHSPNFSPIMLVFCFLDMHYADNLFNVFAYYLKK